MLIPRTQKEVLRQQNPVASENPIIAETHEKAKELGAITSEVEAAKNTIRTTRAEHDRLIRESREAEKIKNGHDRASKDARASVSKLMTKAGDIKKTIHEKEIEVGVLDTQIGLYKDEVESGKKTMEEVHAGLEQANLTLSGLNSQINELNKTLVSLESEAREWEAKIEALKKEETEIMGRIETSIEAFRLFESRIAQFSAETGYLVGYPKVESPKKL